MTDTVSLEIDTHPDLYLSSKEFTGLLVDQQLYRSLFRYEGNETHGDLVKVFDRPSPCTWVFRLVDDAVWDDGERMVAADIVDCIRQYALTPTGSWLTGLVQNLEIHGERLVQVTSRFPVASIERVFATPAISPRRPGAFSGPYRVGEITRAEATFIPRDRGASRVRLVTTSTREEGLRRFHAGELDVCWGIGVPTDFWRSSDVGPFAEATALDLHVIVAAGSAVPQREAASMLEGLTLEAHTVPGVEATRTRFGLYLEGEPTASRSSRLTGWPLYYTPFPPNAQIAAQLASQMKGDLIPTAVGYDEMLSGSSVQDGFSVQIHAGPFPGPHGLMPEVVQLARGRLKSTPEQQELARESWMGDGEQHRLHLLAMLEHHVDRLFKRRVVARMLARFRSRTPMLIPRTGLFDFRQLTKREDAL